MQLNATNRSQCMARECSARMSHRWQACRRWRLGLPIALYQLYLYKRRRKLHLNPTTLENTAFMIRILSTASMCLATYHRLRPTGSRMASGCDPPRRCLQCPVWSGSAKQPSRATAADQSTGAEFPARFPLTRRPAADGHPAQLPGIPVP